MRKSEKNPRYLGEFEEIVLLAIIGLGDEAYGVTIRQEIESKTERITSVGAVYTTLERLEEKGYVSSRQGEATAERGGRAKRFFQVEDAGEKALRQVSLAREKLLKAVRSKRLRV